MQPGPHLWRYCQSALRSLGRAATVNQLLRSHAASVMNQLQKSQGVVAVIQVIQITDRSIPQTAAAVTMTKPRLGHVRTEPEGACGCPVAYRSEMPYLLLESPSRSAQSWQARPRGSHAEPRKETFLACRSDWEAGAARRMFVPHSDHCRKRSVRNCSGRVVAGRPCRRLPAQAIGA